MKLKSKVVFVALLVGLMGTKLQSAPPFSPPPTRDLEAESTSIAIKHPDAVQLVFLKKITDLQLEVVDEKGRCIWKLRSSAEVYDFLRLDTRSWQGRYTIRVQTPSSIEHHTIECK